MSRAWLNTIVTLGVLVALVLGGLWLIKRDRPVRLSVDGARIANAGTVLAQADAVFAALVEADGARPPKGSACWFAPPPSGKGAVSSGRGPRVACGPVLLGVSGTDKPWVTGTVTYQSSNGEAVGTFGKLTAVEALDRGALGGRDGQRPPGTGGLEAPAAALRATDGRRLTGEDRVITASEQAFGRAARRAGAAVASDAGCWFGVEAGATDRQISDGALWCGPILLQGSRPGAPWARWSLSSQSTKSFAVAELNLPTITSVTATVPQEPGTRFYRPDGRTAPDPSGLAPPDATSKEPGYSDVLEDLPDDLQLQPPSGDGRLRIPSRELRIQGVARVPKIGNGRAATVAAEGEELVVASFTRTHPKAGPSDRGTAQLVVGARRQPFPKWASLPEEGALVVSAPRGATPVLLEVLFDGVTQTVSLATGERSADARAASYRSMEPVGIGKAVQLSVALPAGDPAGFSAVVTEARIEAWRERVGWAPPGQAFLTLSFESVKTQTPCCAVANVRVVPTWRLALPSGASVEAQPGSSGTPSSVVFVVPDATTATQLQLAATVTYRHGGADGQRTGAAPPVALELPT